MSLREQAGLTQRQVSVSLNIRQGTVSDWERGATVPHLPADKFFKMEELYKVPVETLVEAFEGESPSTPPPICPPSIYKKLLDKGMTKQDIIDVFGSGEVA